MIKIKVKLINKLGLHARATAKFVSAASRFQSSIKVTKDSQTVDGKSIMGMMMLAASCGHTLTLEINGSDEEEMADAIKRLVKNRFGEAE